MTVIRRGFTLIEVLVVLAVMGLLVTIAIPRFASAKQKAYDAVVIADIERAVTAVESYFATKLSYPTTMNDAQFQPSPGVTFINWDLVNSGVSLHLTAEHVQSANFYELLYPEESKPQRRSRGRKGGLVDGTATKSGPTD